MSSTNKSMVSHRWIKVTHMLKCLANGAQNSKGKTVTCPTWLCKAVIACKVPPHSAVWLPHITGKVQEENRLWGCYFHLCSWVGNRWSLGSVFPLISSSSKALQVQKETTLLLAATDYFLWSEIGDMETRSGIVTLQVTFLPWSVPGAPYFWSWQSCNHAPKEQYWRIVRLGQAVPFIVL